MFDEADALFPKRKEFMSTVMARIVPTFLNKIDKLLKQKAYWNYPIFLFGISNCPEMIDEAFLRPGRFEIYTMEDCQRMIENMNGYLNTT
ncbi:MAG: AAA family ATPase [candidate division WOR-3 bacterium]|nr:AAA family ATPase [candidate division WOR-3 bacterium]MCX7836969.1 AAA family ATPase [candidate division WOR-3 bacterium]